VVECLPSKHEAHSLKPSTAKRKKKFLLKVWFHRPVISATRQEALEFKTTSSKVPVSKTLSQKQKKNKSTAGVGQVV
jgi:hypothetical protein